jgi:hypothetical protein
MNMLKLQVVVTLPFLQKCLAAWGCNNGTRMAEDCWCSDTLAPDDCTLATSGFCPEGTVCWKNGYGCSEKYCPGEMQGVNKCSFCLDFEFAKLQYGDTCSHDCECPVNNGSKGCCLHSECLRQEECDALLSPECKYAPQLQYGDTCTGYGCGCPASATGKTCCLNNKCARVEECNAVVITIAGVALNMAVLVCSILACIGLAALIVLCFYCLSQWNNKKSQPKLDDSEEEDEESNSASE